MIKIYHNPRCSKSREGLEILTKSGKEFEIIKYLENIPTKKELKTIIKALHISAIELVRKSEPIWKEHYQNKSLSEEEVLTALVEHPKLIERPIVILNDHGVIGRPTERITDLLQDQ